MFLKSDFDERLSDILVPSLFFDLYLATATGEQIKVYLLGYKSAFLYNGNGDDSIDNNSIAISLGMTKDEVEECWKYWQKMGVVELEYKGKEMYVKFIDIKYKYLKNLKNGIDEDDSLVDTKEIEDKYSDLKIVGLDCDEDSDYGNEYNYCDMFSDIENEIMRPLVASEKMIISKAIDEYDTPKKLVVEAFRESTKDGGKIKSVNYVVAILKSWFDNSIKSLEDLNTYREKKFFSMSQYKRIFSALGFNRMPTEKEKEIIDKWLNTYDMSMDVVLKACDKSINIPNPNISYFDAIITRWHKADVRTLCDVEEYEKKYESEKAKKSKSVGYKKQLPPLQTRFHNFQKSTSKKHSKENLDRLYELSKPKPKNNK